jgi:hypothetical protein
MDRISRYAIVVAGLLFVAGSAGQPSVLAERKLRFAIHESKKLGEAGIARIGGGQE